MLSDGGVRLEKEEVGVSGVIGDRVPSGTPWSPYPEAKVSFPLALNQVLEIPLVAAAQALDPIAPGEMERVLSSYSFSNLSQLNIQK